MTTPTYAPVVNGRKFDRVARFDDRSLGYTIAQHVQVPSAPPEKKHRARHTWLDQGSEGACTGFSSATALSYAPHVDSAINNSNGEYLYKQAKLNDEYPGENYSGSSVLGAMQGMKNDGLITAYYWATTVDEIINALAFHGVGVFGINWYQAMFNVGADGVIHLDGPLAGGHAICASGYKNGGDLIELDNTWGKGWGQNGSAFIPAEDVNRLMREQGEFACFTKAHPLPTIGTSGRVDGGASGGVTGQ